ncbi:MAG: M4 family metallopeptidase [Bacteroidota bacterium]
MKSITISLCMALLPFFVNAQLLKGKEANKKISGTEQILISEKTGLPEFIQLKAENYILESKAMQWISKVYHFSSEMNMQKISEFIDDAGNTHIKCQLTKSGIPVHDGVFILHTRNGLVYSVNGKLNNEIRCDATPVVMLETAYVAAKQFMPAKSYREGNVENKMFGSTSGQLIFIRATPSSDSPYKLAYRFDVYSQTPLAHKLVFIDAQNGEYIRNLNLIQTHDKPATAVTKYSGNQTIMVDSVSSTQYRLREYSRGNGIATYNLNNGTDTLSYTDFVDPDNYWNTVNPQQDEVATDAHWSSEMTYDYFKNIHGRNSIDGLGFRLKSFVHYDNSFFNAFWDGEAMYYGDGDGSPSTPLTTVDICAHEITHGLTSFTSNFDYVSESGALSEGYSDVFGTCVEFYAKPIAANWTMGEDCGVIIRNVANPNAYNNPDCYLGDFWDTWEEVHCNSTVFSHWFYLSTLGGAGTNEFGETYSITGITQAKAEKIAFRAQTVYLTNTSNYQDARFYTIMSAIDLYGGCSPEVQAVTNAWYAVHVGPAYIDGVFSDFTTSDTAFCSAPALVNFQNLSSNASSFIWNFGDGSATSTVLSPSHTYTANGTYTVSLIADGGTCGKDTLEIIAYISISPSNPCIILMPMNGVGATQTACNGTMYDSGGPTGNYTDNTNSRITIAPTGATSVTLNFVSFEYELDWDTLFIYNGPTTNSPLIGEYTGYSLPNGGTINAGPAVTIRQFTDSYVTEAGFELHWTCTVGIDEQMKENEFVISPNPAKDIVTISGFSGSEPEMIEIFDASGRKVWFENVAANTKFSIPISLESFEAGLYFVNAGNHLPKKFSVVK